jgi:hypothetical protein
MAESYRGVATSDMIHGMKAYAKIIVESDKPDHWVAWLESSPEIAVGGELPVEAIQRLFKMFNGETVFESEEISSIDDATRDGHLEFWIPFQHLRKTPRASTN